MTKTSLRTWMLAIPLAVATCVVGCGGGEEGGGANPAGPGPSNTAPGIKRIMGALAKGPNSLTPVLGKELREAQPAWETIQGQAKEYARLTAEMATLEPPKGSKESWTKLAADYARSASDLDKAAQAKDKDAAIAAHGQLANSCNACHREHRPMGRGGPGGPPPGGPGGPPPGGPDGPPSGGPPPGAPRPE